MIDSEPRKALNPRPNRAPGAARIHLLVAHEAPVAVIIRRKPTKTFHIVKWHLKEDRFEHGSWFKGKIYPLRCDLSWDGVHMVYLAKGSGGFDWNGLCEVPWLKTIADWDNLGTWNGGGLFADRYLLLRNSSILSDIRKGDGWKRQFRIDELEGVPMSEDIPFIYHRLFRDGWRPIVLGPTPESMADAEPFVNGSHEDPPWGRQPDPKLPRLTTRYMGYRGLRGPASNADYKGRSGSVFHFELEGRPDLLGPKVDWANWASTGDLIWAQEGSVFRATPHQLRKEHEPYRFDFEGLVPERR